jgi:hypothetical protein
MYREGQLQRIPVNVAPVPPVSEKRTCGPSCRHTGRGSFRLHAPAHSPNTTWSRPKTSDEPVSVPVPSPSNCPSERFQSLTHRQAQASIPTPGVHLSFSALSSAISHCACSRENGSPLNTASRRRTDNHLARAHPAHISEGISTWSIPLLILQNPRAPFFAASRSGPVSLNLATPKHSSRLPSAVASQPPTVAPSQP